jgi:glutathione S-transferase
MTDQGELLLHQPPRAFGVPNPSPFCIKLETWLRLAEIPYRMVPCPDPRKGPKDKIPFVTIGGETIGDSEFIIAALSERYGVDLDKGLSAPDRAVATAFTRMLEEHLYWAAVHSRWMEPEAFAVLKKAFFGRLPPGLRQLLPVILLRGLRRTLQGQGLGRHEPAEIYRKAERDLQAVSDFLAAKPFVMGDAPRTVDASAYGILTSIIDAQVPTPLQPIGRGFKNLVAYTRRMREAYFADLEAEAA